MNSIFNPGERVKRTRVFSLGRSEYNGMRIGDEDTVVSSNGKNIELKKFGRGHSPDNLELISTYHPHYDVIVAWAKGQKIQVKHSKDNVWKDWTHGFDNTPLFGIGKESWKIKPNNPHEEEIKNIEKEMRILSDRLKTLRKEM